MLVYLRDGSAQTVARAATLRQVVDPTCYIIRSQCTDTLPASPSADPITPGAEVTPVILDLGPVSWRPTTVK